MLVVWLFKCVFTVWPSNREDWICGRMPRFPTQSKNLLSFVELDWAISVQSKIYSFYL